MANTVAIVGDVECFNDDCLRQGKCRMHKKGQGEGIEPELSFETSYEPTGGAELTFTCKSFKA